MVIIAKMMLILVQYYLDYQRSKLTNTINYIAKFYSQNIYIM